MSSARLRAPGTFFSTLRSWLAGPALSLALGGATFGGTFLAAPPASADLRIAVVDTQRAIMETEDGLRAQATLKKLFDSRQREIDAKQQQLAKERQDIEKQRNVLSQQALKKRMEAYQAAVIQLQASFVQYNKELQRKEGELTQPIFQKVMALISRLARQGGYDIIVDKRSVPYVRTDLDLTERVIGAYNRGGVAPDGDAGKGKGKGAKGKATPKKKPAPRK